MYKTKVVVLAIKSLGGESHLEHIAVKCSEIDPKQFKFKHYNHPNAFIVMRAIRQATTNEYITKTGKHEWKITDMGLKLVEGTEIKQVSTSRGIFDPQKFIHKVRNSDLFKEFAETGVVKDWDGLCFVIDCSPDMDKEAINIKYKRFCEKINAIKDTDGVNDIVQFADLCGNILREGEE